MDGYSISEVAERTGFPASTLRFYEQSGLVHPARTRAGYRCYDDGHIERLSFVGRAKRFGLSLEEITDLLALLDEERCAPVQGRLRDLVDERIADAQARIAELVRFTTELQRVAASLTTHTPDGPCDDGCGCTCDQAPTVAGIARPTESEEPPVACTLRADQMDGRIADWQVTLDDATVREPIAGGVRVRFARGVDASALAALAADEQDCCRFLDLAIRFDTDGVALDVTGPDDARPIIDALVGVAG